MRKVTSLTRIFVLLLCSLILSSCVKHWNLHIFDDVDGNPILCFSRSNKCDDVGVQLASVSVRRVCKSGAEIESSWELQGWSDNQSDYMLKKIKYGVVPSGWKELSMPIPIQVGEYYSVNGEYYFFKKIDGMYVVMSREKFFDLEK